MPDFLLVKQSGMVRVVNVKPANRVQDPKIAEALAWPDLAQPLVREHCHRLGMPYTEAGLIDSYVQALRHMHAVGAPLRATR